MRSVRGGGELVDRFGRAVPAAPVVRLRVDRTPGGVPLLVDDVAVPVGRGADPHRAGLAAAARRAAHLGRPVRVEMAGRWSAWPLVVHPDGAVDDARAARATPVAGTGGAWDGVGRRSRRRAPALAGVADRPRRRPVGVLAVAGTLAATLLVGAFGTGVVTLAAPSAAPAECRDVTLFAVNGSGAAGGETLAAVTDPLVQQVGERLAVVAVAGPEVGASYEASEQQAVTTLTDQVAAQLAACPGSRAMLFGYSQGAHVAGDVAARIGAGQDPRVPADRVLAVGLFGDPARSAGVRTVPAGVTGQGVLPAREGGFGALAARTIEVCAPQDPVCATAAGATPPPLEQAVAAPAHIDYPQLTVAPDTPATAWASESLGRLITSLPAPGTAPAGGQPTGTATGAPSPGTTAPGTTAPGTTAPSSAAPTGQAPAGGGDYGDGSDASAGTGGAGTGSAHQRGRRRRGRAPTPATTPVPARPSPRARRLPGRARGPGRRGRPLPGRAPTRATTPERPGQPTPVPTPATTREGTSAAAQAPRRPPPRRARGRARAVTRAGRRPRRRRAPARAAPARARIGADGLAGPDRHHGAADRRDGIGTGTGSGTGSADSSATPRSTTPPDESPATGRGSGTGSTGTGSTGTRTGSAPGSDASGSGGEDAGGDASDSEASGADDSGSGGVGAAPTTTRTTPSDAGGARPIGRRP